MKLNMPSNIKLDKISYCKMNFIINALEEGWTIKKKKDTYIFLKKHENRREIFQEDYLETFLKTTSSL